MRTALAVTLLVAGWISPARAGELGSTAAAASVRMTVREVRAHQGSPVVLLQTDGARQILPIWIGTSEAQAIQLRMNSQQAVRPLTLDLLQTILGVLGAKVERVEVDDLKDNIFLGKVSLRDARGRRYRVDGRPSDLIGLAVGAKLPVWVAPRVLQRAGQEASKWVAPPATPAGGVSF